MGLGSFGISGARGGCGEGDANAAHSAERVGRHRLLKIKGLWAAFGKRVTQFGPGRFRCQGTGSGAAGSGRSSGGLELADRPLRGENSTGD